MHFALLLAAVALTTSCDGKGKTLPAAQPRPVELEALGHQLGVSFPPGVEVLGSEHQEGLDDMWRAKVRMSRGAAKLLLDSTPIKPEAFRAGGRGFLGSDKGWWDPHRSLHLRTGQAALPGGRVLNVGLDDGRPEETEVDVFIVNHGT